MDIVIDKNALIANAKYIKSRVSPSLLCAVVKNNAYGHGLEQVCEVLSSFADYFAVGSISEAKIAGKFGKELLILLPVLSVADTIDAILNGYNITLDSNDTLMRILSAARLCGKRANVHLKIDSGMSRLGFDSRKIAAWLPPLKSAVNQGYICVKGIYSHFASAENNTQFTLQQYKAFVRTCQAVKHVLDCDNIITHIANSSGALGYADYHADMVRCGLALYGYGDIALIPVKQVYATVLSRKSLKAGDCVGYECSYQCKAEKDVAVLDIGYANGLPRVLSGKLTFDYNGHKLRQIGNVCMAMTMVDCSNTNLKIGDKVTILGTDNLPFNNGKYSIYQLLCDLRQ